MKDVIHDVITVACGVMVGVLLLYGLGSLLKDIVASLIRRLSGRKRARSLRWRRVPQASRGNPGDEWDTGNAGLPHHGDTGCGGGSSYGGGGTGCGGGGSGCGGGGGL